MSEIGGKWSKCWNLSETWGIKQNVEILVLILNSIKMLIFEWKVGNQSKSWRFGEIRWELVKMLKFAKCQIDQNIEIWVQQGGINQKVEISAKKGRLIKCWYFIAKLWIYPNVWIWLKNKELIRILKLKTKLGINQNAKIWVLITKSFKMLYFEWKVGNESKSWHLSAIRWELIKMLKFERKRVDWSNVDILLQKWKSIKLLEFDWKIRNWSEYWNLRTTLRIDQNVEIWVQNCK